MDGVKLRAGWRQSSTRHQAPAYDRRDLLICERRYTSSPELLSDRYWSLVMMGNSMLSQHVLSYSPSHTVLKNLYPCRLHAANVHILLLFSFLKKERRIIPSTLHNLQRGNAPPPASANHISLLHSLSPVCDNCLLVRP